MSKKFKSFASAYSFVMQMAREYEVIKTQSSDGELHLVLSELKINESFADKCDLDEAQIREIMRKEAQKPLLLTRR